MVSQTPMEYKACITALLLCTGYYTMSTKKPKGLITPTTTVVPSIVVAILHTAVCYGYAAVYPEVEENAKLCAIGAAVLTGINYLAALVLWHGLTDASPNFCLIGNCINQFLILPGLLYMAWATKDPSLSNTEWLEQPWGGVSDPAFRYETWVMWMFCGFMVKDIPWCWVYNGPLVIQHHITVYVGTALFLDDAPVAGRYVILVMVFQEIGSGLFNVFTLCAYEYRLKQLFPLVVVFAIGAFASNVIGITCVVWHLQHAEYSAWFFFFGLASPIIAGERQNHVHRHIGWYYSDSGPGSTSAGVKKTA